MKFLFWKKREYPIKRDEEGRSLRQQAFELFDDGYRPSQIYKQQLVAASQKTLFRYYEDWKKKGSNRRYRILKEVRRRNPDITQQLIGDLSTVLGVPVEEVTLRLAKPWGLMQALRGEWPDYRLQEKRSGNERRLHAALKMLLFAELFRNSPKQLGILLFQIAMITENTKLEITKESGEIIVKKESKGKTKTIRLPAFKGEIPGFLSLDT